MDINNSTADITNSKTELIEEENIGILIIFNLK